MSIPALPEDCVLLGKIVGVHGVQGWLKIESYTRPRESIFQYLTWELQTSQGRQPREVLVPGATRAVLAGRTQGKGLVAQLQGVTDRNQAQALIGVYILIAKDRLTPLEPGEHYWIDLEGCAVINQQGVHLGKVSYLLETGANDVLVVSNGKERLIPYADIYIDEVDTKQKTIRVNWDEDF